jgi:hypothetical protein
MEAESNGVVIQRNATCDAKLCHYAVMMPYAAYLRIYEPLSAFIEPDRTRWMTYASPSARLRRMNATAQEQAEELRRVIAVPPVLIPERESEHAFIRWLEGMTYICPWQTRLRSILALAELRACGAVPLASASTPDEAVATLAGLGDGGLTAKLYIKTMAWSVPLTWFVPFVPTDRVGAREGDEQGSRTEGVREAGGSRSVVPPEMTVPLGLYATTMSLARQRVRRAVAILRGAIRQLPSKRGTVAREALTTEADLGGLCRWMTEFHPYSLIELDYSGLAGLLGDSAHRCDETVAEVAAAVDALARSEWEVAMAMHQRARARWRVPQAIASAS